MLHCKYILLGCILVTVILIYISYYVESLVQKNQGSVMKKKTICFLSSENESKKHLQYDSGSKNHQFDLLWDHL